MGVGPAGKKRRSRAERLGVMDETRGEISPIDENEEWEKVSGGWAPLRVMQDQTCGWNSEGWKEPGCETDAIES